MINLPDVRLFLLTNASSESNRRVHDAFAQNGVGGDRVECVERRPRDQYLELYREVDICLDPFPYNGGVTTCDALWMGVPVVSLAGNTYVSRQGVSVLSNLGLHDLVAATADSYVEIATGLARDLGQLEQLRMGLRDRMRRSTSTDPHRFTRSLEEVYRWIWETWCLTRKCRTP
jgi:protein O-GlcNAc transferase